jgi:gamma-glutamyltranspeptidase / glutathione hydrolase
VYARARLTVVVWLALALAYAGSCALAPVTARAQGGDRAAATAQRHMAAAANPLAAEAGRQILRAGGSAVDAAIAMQMVLTLVEPQAAGIGGGGFLVHYDGSTKEIATYDGRETAPAAATPEMFLDAQGQPLPLTQAALGGAAIGVPGLLRMMEMAHRAHGRLAWARLFEPAMQLADEGFPISERLFKQVSENKRLREFPAAAKYFYDEAGNPRPVGYRLRNPALYETLRMIANGGADAFYAGAMARDIVAAVKHAGTAERPGLLTLADLAGYRALRRDPVCSQYRVNKVCGMGPPSSGGIAIAEILGMLEPFNMKGYAPGSVESVHLISEASRLAFADRARFVADPDFVQVPVKGLTDPRYLARRAKGISLDRANTRVEAGKPAGLALNGPVTRWADSAAELPATTHISVIDGAGNAVAMTNSIEQAFGSHVFVRGFLLNNHMTDFSLRPAVNDVPTINRIEPGKRPRSSMSPTIVVDKQDRLVATLGSPGGTRIIPYVAQTLVGVLDNGLNIQQAINLPHHVNMNGATEIEKGTALTAIAPALKALGHEVTVETQTSGLQGIVVVRRGKTVQLVGGADPRREGEAVGD